MQSPDEQEMPELSLESLIKDLPTTKTESIEDTQVNNSKYTQARFKLLPTPSESLFLSFLTQIRSQTSQNQDKVRRSKDNLLILN